METFEQFVERTGGTMHQGDGVSVKEFATWPTALTEEQLLYAGTLSRTPRETME